MGQDICVVSHVVLEPESRSKLGYILIYDKSMLSSNFDRCARAYMKASLRVGRPIFRGWCDLQALFPGRLFLFPSFFLPVRFSQSCSTWCWTSWNTCPAQASAASAL